MESFVTRIGDVTIERVVPRSERGGPAASMEVTPTTPRESDVEEDEGIPVSDELKIYLKPQPDLDPKKLLKHSKKMDLDAEESAMSTDGEDADSENSESEDEEVERKIEKVTRSESEVKNDDEDGGGGDDDGDSMQRTGESDNNQSDDVEKPVEECENSSNIEQSDNKSSEHDADQSEPGKRKASVDGSSAGESNSNTHKKKKRSSKSAGKDDDKEGKKGSSSSSSDSEGEKSSDPKSNVERKLSNLRRNIREVMSESQLDEETLNAQRQEMERLRRVQEQQRIIREVQRQIALNRQNNKTQNRVISILQGNSSILKQIPGTSGGSPQVKLPNTVLVKLGSSGNSTVPTTTVSQGGKRQLVEFLRVQKSISGTSTTQTGPVRSFFGNKARTMGGVHMMTPSVSIAPVVPGIKKEPHGSESESEEESESDADAATQAALRKVTGKPRGKDVVTISSSSDDDCILLSEPSSGEETENVDDPTNSGIHTNDLYNTPDDQGRVLVNVGHPAEEQDIFVAPQIARVIKPHQIGGVRFLFDNVVESVERFNTSTGFGCILAHSMGLGKTLQIVCFCDIFLRHTSGRTVLCIMPINTLQNWVAEFNLWLPVEEDIQHSPLAAHGEIRPRNFPLHVLNDSHKSMNARSRVIHDWNKDGGVLLIGYELYRQLSLKRPSKVKKGRRRKMDDATGPEEDDKNKALLEEMHQALVKPGPDLVICDEGHRIKNSHASISQALKQIRSKRRVVLTGYPLQNNLLEYWCMVDFVRPNYLGTKTEFCNMFERPIQNGQCIDSTPQDIRLMRYRAHVLHSLLEGFVQRRSHSVLQISLPQKEEYVLLLRMTAFQRKLYNTFMNEVVRTKAVPNPLKAFAVCCKIWNHPDILYYFLKKRAGAEDMDLDLEEATGAAGTPGGGSTATGGPCNILKNSMAPKRRGRTPKNSPPKKEKKAQGPFPQQPCLGNKPAATIMPSTTNNMTSTVSTPTQGMPGQMQGGAENDMPYAMQQNANFVGQNPNFNGSQYQNVQQYQQNPNAGSSAYNNPPYSQNPGDNFTPNYGDINQYNAGNTSTTYNTGTDHNPANPPNYSGAQGNQYYTQNNTSNMQMGFGNGMGYNYTPGNSNQGVNNQNGYTSNPNDSGNTGFWQNNNQYYQHNPSGDQHTGQNENMLPNPFYSPNNYNSSDPAASYYMNQTGGQPYGNQMDPNSFRPDMYQNMNNNGDQSFGVPNSDSNQQTGKEKQGNANGENGSATQQNHSANQNPQMSVNQSNSQNPMNNPVGNQRNNLASHQSLADNPLGQLHLMSDMANSMQNTVNEQSSIHQLHGSQNTGSNADVVMNNQTAGHQILGEPQQNSSVSQQSHRQIRQSNVPTSDQHNLLNASNSNQQNFMNTPGSSHLMNIQATNQQNLMNIQGSNQQSFANIPASGPQNFNEQNFQNSSNATQNFVVNNHQNCQQNLNGGSTSNQQNFNNPVGNQQSFLSNQTENQYYTNNSANNHQNSLNNTSSSQTNYINNAPPNNSHNFLNNSANNAFVNSSDTQQTPILSASTNLNNVNSQNSQQSTISGPQSITNPSDQPSLMNNSGQQNTATPGSGQPSFNVQNCQSTAIPSGQQNLNNPPNNQLGAMPFSSTHQNNMYLPSSQHNMMSSSNSQSDLTRSFTNVPGSHSATMNSSQSNMMMPPYSQANMMSPPHHSSVSSSHGQRNMTSPRGLPAIGSPPHGQRNMTSPHGHSKNSPPHGPGQSSMISPTHSQSHFTTPHSHNNMTSPHNQSNMTSPHSHSNMTSPHSQSNMTSPHGHSNMTSPHGPSNMTSPRSHQNMMSPHGQPNMTSPHAQGSATSPSHGQQNITNSSSNQPNMSQSQQNTLNSYPSIMNPPGSLTDLLNISADQSNIMDMPDKLNIASGQNNLSNTSGQLNTVNSSSSQLNPLTGHCSMNSAGAQTDFNSGSCQSNSVNSMGSQANVTDHSQSKAGNGQNNFMSQQNMMNQDVSGQLPAMNNHVNTMNLMSNLPNSQPNLPHLGDGHQNIQASAMTHQTSDCSTTSLQFPSPYQSMSGSKDSAENAEQNFGKTQKDPNKALGGDQTNPNLNNSTNQQDSQKNSSNQNFFGHTFGSASGHPNIGSYEQHPTFNYQNLMVHPSEQHNVQNSASSQQNMNLSGNNQSNFMNNVPTNDYKSKKSHQNATATSGTQQMLQNNEKFSDQTGGSETQYDSQRSQAPPGVPGTSKDSFANTLEQQGAMCKMFNNMPNSNTTFQYGQQNSSFSSSTVGGTDQNSQNPSQNVLLTSSAGTMTTTSSQSYTAFDNQHMQIGMVGSQQQSSVGSQTPNFPGASGNNSNSLGGIMSADQASSNNLQNQYNSTPYGSNYNPYSGTAFNMDGFTMNTSGTPQNMGEKMQYGMRGESQNSGYAQGNNLYSDQCKPEPKWEVKSENNENKFSSSLVDSQTNLQHQFTDAKPNTEVKPKVKIEQAQHFTCDIKSEKDQKVDSSDMKPASSFFGNDGNFNFMGDNKMGFASDSKMCSTNDNNMSFTGDSKMGFSSIQPLNTGEGGKNDGSLYSTECKSASTMTSGFEEKTLPGEELRKTYDAAAAPNESMQNKFGKVDTASECDMLNKPDEDNAKAVQVTEPKRMVEVGTGTTPTPTPTPVASNLGRNTDPGIPYDWAIELLKNYIPGSIESSAKMEVFFCILEESILLGDRLLVFSQSLFTLNLIEDFLQRSPVPGREEKWARNVNYYRLDGSTSALEREKLINEYNLNPNIHLFLVSTRAGSLGINLVGANRVVVFDASWNPCHDTQAVCRVYRYGQQKPCFVYRLVMDNCLEKKIYDRQINKQGMSDRVVDECNPDAHLTIKDVTNLCWDSEDDGEEKDFTDVKDKFIDIVLQSVLTKFGSKLTKEPFQHESLLVDRKEKKLSQAEKRLAKRSYELEKQASINYNRPQYAYYPTAGVGNAGVQGGLQIRYRTIRTDGVGGVMPKPVASVRPMQAELNSQIERGAGGQPRSTITTINTGRTRWIPAEVWQRQGMSAQEMTLPLDVVIPTNSPDRASIVLKAGQRVMVLKSPKGIYMQLENGKIIAIRTAFKVERSGKGGPAQDFKGSPIDKADGEIKPADLKKELNIPSTTTARGVSKISNVFPFKNNSAITIIPKGANPTGPRASRPLGKAGFASKQETLVKPWNSNPVMDHQNRMPSPRQKMVGPRFNQQMPLEARPYYQGQGQRMMGKMAPSMNQPTGTARPFMHNEYESYEGGSDSSIHPSQNLMSGGELVHARSSSDDSEAAGFSNASRNPKSMYSHVPAQRDDLDKNADVPYDEVMGKDHEGHNRMDQEGFPRIPDQRAENYDTQENVDRQDWHPRNDPRNFSSNSRNWEESSQGNRDANQTFQANERMFPPESRSGPTMDNWNRNVKPQQSKEGNSGNFGTGYSTESGMWESSSGRSSNPQRPWQSSGQEPGKVSYQTSSGNYPDWQQHEQNPQNVGPKEMYGNSGRSLEQSENRDWKSAQNQSFSNVRGESENYIQNPENRNWQSQTNQFPGIPKQAGSSSTDDTHEMSNRNFQPYRADGKETEISSSISKLHQNYPQVSFISHSNAANNSRQHDPSANPESGSQPNIAQLETRNREMDHRMEQSYNSTSRPLQHDKAVKNFRHPAFNPQAKDVSNETSNTSNTSSIHEYNVKSNPYGKEQFPKQSANLHGYQRNEPNRSSFEDRTYTERNSAANKVTEQLARSDSIPKGKQDKFGMPYSFGPTSNTPVRNENSNKTTPQNYPYVEQPRAAPTTPTKRGRGSRSKQDATSTFAGNFESHQHSSSGPVANANQSKTKQTVTETSQSNTSTSNAPPFSATPHHQSSDASKHTDPYGGNNPYGHQYMGAPGYYGFGQQAAPPVSPYGGPYYSDTTNYEKPPSLTSHVDKLSSISERIGGDDKASQQHTKPTTSHRSSKKETNKNVDATDSRREHKQASQMKDDARNMSPGSATGSRSGSNSSRSTPAGGSTTPASTAADSLRSPEQFVSSSAAAASSGFTTYTSSSLSSSSIPHQSPYDPVLGSYPSASGQYNLPSSTATLLPNPFASANYTSPIRPPTTATSVAPYGAGSAYGSAYGPGADGQYESDYARTGMYSAFHRPEPHYSAPAADLASPFLPSAANPPPFGLPAHPRSSATSPHASNYYGQNVFPNPYASRSAYSAPTDGGYGVPPYGPSTPGFSPLFNPHLPASVHQHPYQGIQTSSSNTTTTPQTTESST